MEPLDPKYTHVELNLISVQVWLQLLLDLDWHAWIIKVKVKLDFKTMTPILLNIKYTCTAQEKKKMTETLMVNLFPTEDAVLSLNCCVLPQVRHQAQEGQLQEQQEV